MKTADSKNRKIQKGKMEQETVWKGRIFNHQALDWV
jgi:hypothetical protein